MAVKRRATSRRAPTLPQCLDRRAAQRSEANEVLCLVRIVRESNLEVLHGLSLPRHPPPCSQAFAVATTVPTRWSPGASPRPSSSSMRICRQSCPRHRHPRAQTPKRSETTSLSSSNMSAISRNDGSLPSGSSKATPSPLSLIFPLFQMNNSTSTISFASSDSLAGSARFDTLVDSWPLPLRDLFGGP